MRQEWIERLHDQARMGMGACVQDSDDTWCRSHGALKFPGEEACRAMSVAYDIAESAGEVMEELARADERERDVLRGVSFRIAKADAVEAALADLRAKVLGLPIERRYSDESFVMVRRSDVLALFPEEES